MVLLQIPNYFIKLSNLFYQFHKLLFLEPLSEAHFNKFN